MEAYKKKIIRKIINRRIHNITEINKKDYEIYDKSEVNERRKQARRFKNKAIDEELKKSKYFDVYINNQTDK